MHLLQVIQRIDRLLVFVDRKMQVRASGIPRRADKRDPLTALHLLPFADKNAAFLDVAIQRPQATAVIDDHRVAIAVYVAGDDHLAVLRSHNWRPFRRWNVNAIV